MPSRRLEILALAQDHIYGQLPDPLPVNVSSSILVPTSLGDIPARIRLFTLQIGSLLSLPVLLALPDHPGPHPCLVGLNFTGNHTLLPHPEIPVSACRVYGPGYNFVPAHTLPRGFDASTFDIAASVRQGFAVATACYGDLQEDAPAGHGLLGQIGLTTGPQRTGAIALWAWGLSRILDALLQLPDIDPRRVAVLGHSRLGKTALLAGVVDERFAAILPSQSGTGGVAPHVKSSTAAESVAKITSVFPHWFAPAYAAHAPNPAAIPITPADLLRAAAPRPVLVCNATDDLWADPDGQFAMLLAAAVAFPDRGGLAPDAKPQVSARIGHTLAYFLRPGPHAMTPTEWHQFRDFCREVL